MEGLGTDLTFASSRLLTSVPANASSDDTLLHLSTETDRSCTKLAGGGEDASFVKGGEVLMGSLLKLAAERRLKVEKMQAQMNNLEIDTLVFSNARTREQRASLFPLPSSHTNKARELGLPDGTSSATSEDGIYEATSVFLQLDGSLSEGHSHRESRPPPQSRHMAHGDKHVAPGRRENSVDLRQSEPSDGKSSRGVPSPPMSPQSFPAQEQHPKEAKVWHAHGLSDLGELSAGTRRPARVSPKLPLQENVVGKLGDESTSSSEDSVGTSVVVER